MPVNSHLTWVEVTNFTSGLWDVESPGELLSDKQSFSVLTDWEPQIEGGLRAFYQGTALDVSDIGLTASQIATGIYSRGGAVGTAGQENDQFLSTINPANGRAHLYRKDFANGDSAWTSMYDDAGDDANVTSEVSEFLQFVQNNNDTWLMWVKRGGNNPGVYSIKVAVGGTDTSNATAAGSVSKRYATTGPIVSSQGRFLWSAGRNINWSDLGSILYTGVSPGTANTQQIGEGEPDGTIGMLSQRAPADLLVGLAGAPWYEINGSIADVGVPIRAMGDDHHQRVHFQKPCRVPGGIAFIEPGGRIYITDGNTFTSISDPIGRFDIDVGSNLGPGQLAFLNDYIFAPGGRVYDMRTKAWFRSSFMHDSAYHHGVQSGRVYMCNSVPGLSAGYIRIYEGGGAISRATSATFQTVPFSDALGKNVRMREMQVLAKNYAATTYVATIIDSREVVVAKFTIASKPAGRHMHSFLFPDLGDHYLSVALTASTDNGTSEAPTVERVRFGFAPNNLLSNASE